MSSWESDPAVAAGQREVVAKELAALHEARAFVHFIRAMEYIHSMTGEKIESLLDCGCGCGHYGEVLRRFWPGIKYHGFDISPHMVAIAKQVYPSGHIWQCGFEEAELFLADVILLSQVIEYTERPLESLKKLVEIEKWVILHKIRTTAKSTHLINEPTYAGHHEQCLLWNVTELTQQLWNAGICVIGLPLKWDARGDIITLVGRCRNYV